MVQNESFFSRYYGMKYPRRKRKKKVNERDPKNKGQTTNNPFGL